MRAWFGQSIWSALKTTFHNWGEHDGSLMSAAMAFYASFSLLPLLLVLVAGMGIVSRFSSSAQNARDDVLNVVSRNAGPWVEGQLKSVLAGVESKAGVSGPLGLATLVLGAIGVFAQFENLFQRIWRLPGSQKKGVIAAVRLALRERALAFGMLLFVGLLVLVIFVANLVLSGLQPQVERWAGGKIAWRYGQILLNLSFNTVLFSLIYKVLPRVPIRWREALAGGVLVAVIWEVGQRVFEQAVVGDRFSAYGVIGSFIAVMMWMYYVSATVFLGAEFVRALCCDSGLTSPVQNPDAN